MELTTPLDPQHALKAFGRIRSPTPANSQGTTFRREWIAGVS
jgi:hypothetical protein